MLQSMRNSEGNSMIRLILLDIDGTLTNDAKQITPKTRDALIKAQASGIRLAIASGRPDQGLMQFAKILNMDSHHGLFVCYNGAKVMDFQSGEVYFRKAMTPVEGKAVLEHIKKFQVTPIVAKGEYMYTDNVFGCCIERNGKPFNVIEYESRGNGYLLREEKDMAAFADFEIEKILTAGEPDYLQAHYEEMQEPFRDSLSCMFTAPFYFEYTAKGIDKAKAIETALGELGYERSEMIAFGDAQNDRTMLEYAGIGVAMGNAVKEVKEIADYITDDNNSDGIANALHHFLGI